MTTHSSAPKSKVEASRKRPKTGGRTKGTPNKTTKELKDIILNALDGAGGQTYLETVAKSHPAAFLSLVGKVLPLQVAGMLEHSGGITVNIQQF
jgi:hypothetical protein